MNDESAKFSYGRQFLAGKRQAVSAASYKDSFIKTVDHQSSFRDNMAQSDPMPETDCKEPQKPIINPNLIWEKNAARFSEDQLPSLTTKSIKQLESNFRELMLVEANINTLTKKGNLIYVSSCSDQSGKTISAISAAYGLTFYSHKNVLIMDGNLTNPQLHQLFGITPDPGFKDVCAGIASIDDVILPTRHKNLSVMTIGNMDLPPGSDSCVRQIIAELSPNFDYVICDGSSILTSSVALRNIPAFDAVLIVIECEKTRLEVLQLAEEKIQKSGGPTSIGVVFNRRKYYIPSIVYKVISKK
jgi:Mrp family chromosome partitioning ATPase